MLKVIRTEDFPLTGDGTAPEWFRAAWNNLTRVKGEAPYETRFKILYSPKGIYCLFYCQDKKIIATLNSHNAELWTEDVVEAFFWPSQDFPAYFEYELSPNNFELTLLVPNHLGKFHGWLPWGDAPERQTRHATRKTPKAWTAEFFIPFEMLKPLPNCPPVSGTTWRANFYRIDHDLGETYFCWNPVEKHFHEYQNFGTIEFE